MQPKGMGILIKHSSTPGDSPCSQREWGFSLSTHQHQGIAQWHAANTRGGVNSMVVVGIQDLENKLSILKFALEGHLWQKGRIMKSH